MMTSADHGATSPSGNGIRPNTRPKYIYLLHLAFRRRLRDCWENLYDWIEVFAFRFRLARTDSSVPNLLLYFGFAPGDDLMCTALLRELQKRSRTDVLMISNHPELFIGNSDVGSVHPIWKRYSDDASTTAICRRFAKLSGAKFYRPHYAPKIEGEDRSRSPSRHIIAELCASAGIRGRIAIRPYLQLTEEEQKAGGWAAGKIIIQSSGMGGRHPIRNKQWNERGFQEVVSALAGTIDFVQLGAPDDPLLVGTRDLRGATTIRETAAILANARLFVGTVGFLMHVARAVECPSVIIFGGREAPWQSGYACNLNLYSAVPCAPCWRWNSCEFDRKCMTNITVSDVTNAIGQMLSRPRGPLEVETVEVLARDLGVYSDPSIA